MYRFTLRVWTHGIQEFSRQITEFLLQKKSDGIDVWGLVYLCLWVWRPSLWSQPQGDFWITNDLQERPFQQCVTLSAQYAGKAIFFWGRKDINRECVFRSLPYRDCLASKTWDFQAGLAVLTSNVRVVCLPRVPEPANSFLGHFMTAHEETGCGRVSESAGCPTVVI